MTGFITIVCVVLGLAIALVAGVRALLDRPTTRAEFAAAAVLEAAVLVYVIVRVADLIGGHTVDGTGIVVAYLFGLVLAMPVTVALSAAEKTRWGSVVLACGALVTCVLFARIDQLWTAHG